MFNSGFRFNFKQVQHPPWARPFCSFQFAHAFMEFPFPFQGRLSSQSIPFWGGAQC